MVVPTILLTSPSLSEDIPQGPAIHTPPRFTAEHININQQSLRVLLISQATNSGSVSS